MISTTGFLALCDSGYEPLRKENLATAGVGPYLIRVHASDRSSDGKKPRFLIQVIPGERTGAEPEPPSSTIEESAGPLLVRTSFEQPDEWARLLQALEGGSEHYESITVIDNRAYAGFTADQIQARIGRDDEDWPDSTLVLIADEWALASAEFPLLAVNNLPEMTTIRSGSPSQRPVPSSSTWSWRTRALVSGAVVSTPTASTGKALLTLLRGRTHGVRPLSTDTWPDEEPPLQVPPSPDGYDGCGCACTATPTTPNRAHARPPAEAVPSAPPQDPPTRPD